MSSVGLNKWIVSGNLAADAEIKTVDLKSGEKAKVAKGTIYVRKGRKRDESFTVSINIWESSSAWRMLPFLKKGSLIICTGSLEPNPYISNSDNLPKAGLSMTVVDIDLDNVRMAEEEEPSGESVPTETTDMAGTKSKTTKKAEKSPAMV
jgi:single-stranded DNA-binding protein